MLTRAFIAGHDGLAGRCIADALRGAGTELRTDADLGGLADGPALDELFETFPPLGVVDAVPGTAFAGAGPASAMAGLLRAQNTLLSAAHRARVGTLLYVWPCGEASRWYRACRETGATLAQAWRRERGLRSAVVVPRGLAGWEDAGCSRPVGAVARLVRDIHRARCAGADTVEVAGDPASPCPFLSAGDWARTGLELLREGAGGETVVIDPVSDVLLGDVAGTVARVAGYSGRIVWRRGAPLPCPEGDRVIRVATGRDLEAAIGELCRAHAAGAGHSGAGRPEEDGAPPGAAGVLEMVRTWRAEGLAVGFTNGCFDLLHAGHVSLLRQARAECDRLVVGLNNDSSVSRLKGPGRPVHSVDQRTAVLSAIRDVDAVMVFAEDTPERVIRDLQPDILVKGADYAENEVVGADFVRARGGRVVLARLEAGLGSTRVIERLARAGIRG